MRRALSSWLPHGTSRTIMVTDERMARESHFLELAQLLEEDGVEVDLIDSVQPECPAEEVAETASSIGKLPDVIVAVGGGSVIDFAKVLGLLLAYGGVPQDYYGEFAVPAPTVPVIALPTTAGTGSEATPVAVVSDAHRELKVGISSPHLIPVAAICDPELTDSAPPSLTAATGADALSHCIEAFTAIRRQPTASLPTERVFVGKNELGDLYALEGIRAVGRSLRAAVSSDRHTASVLSAREDMMFAALAGGIALGTGGTSAAHALQYPVGAVTRSPHGVGVAVLLPYVMAFNRPERVEELAQIAIALGVEDDGDLVGLSHRAVDAVCDLFEDIGIPRTLADLGVAPDTRQWIARQAFTTRRLVDNNPRALSIEALAAITEAAHAGDLSRLGHTPDRI
jgi:alcohol dehydrogenase